MLVPETCGNGFCCPAATECVKVGGQTACYDVVLGISAPAVPQSATSSMSTTLSARQPTPTPSGKDRAGMLARNNVTHKRTAHGLPRWVRRGLGPG